MGMDLVPINPSKDAPQLNGSIIPGRYNWSGWGRLCKLLDEWEVDCHDIDGFNDGNEISEETCMAIADAIEAHLSELSQEDQDWLRPHIVRWRTCGGYEQW